MATQLPKLSEETITANLAGLNGWARDGKMITREFVCSGFSEAANFITQIAPLANGMNHHPDVLLHKFKRVRIMLWTHSQDGLTQNDFDLAAKIDALAG